MSTIREPLFNFEILTNSNTTFDWLFKTNQLIQGMNTLYVADVVEGDGICLARNGGIVQINVDPGPGLGFTSANDLTLNFSGIPEISSLTSTSPTVANDYLVIERGNIIRKIKANSILPTTILHNHTFDGTIDFSNNINLKPSKQPYDTADRWSASINVGTSASLVYEGFNSLWYFDKNISLGTSNAHAIISKNTGAGISPNTVESIFNFCTPNILGTNPDTDSDDVLPTILSFNFNVGAAPETWDQGNVGTTNSWPTTWKLKFDSSSAKFFHYDSSTSDNTQELFSLEKIGSFNNLVKINGKIFVSDLQNSTQFINTPDGSQYKVPLTNSVGLLDKKFTNRIITTDFTEVFEAGSLVVVGNFTDGDTEYKLGIANGIGSSDIIGIVESVGPGVATIVLSGEFDLPNAALIPGAKYFLSQTESGKFVTENTYESGILKPVFVAITSTKGILLPSAAPLTSNIGSIVVNYGEPEEETLDIDSENYPLKFVAGPNIRFNITSNNEVEIRVIDAAGAQDTFKTINVDGVGSTDGSGSITANLPNQAFTLKSTTLSIFGDDETKQIQIEAPNAFTNFRFSDSNSNHVFNPETVNDTLHFVAGTGISFEQNTDDSIIISASVNTIVTPSTLAYTKAYQAFVSHSSTQGSTVSLLGGNDADKFNANWSSVVLSDTPVLSHWDTIKYDPGSQTWADSYTIHQSYHDSGVGDKYLPDELAGYVFGRITPSLTVSGSNYFTYPSDRIQRLTRRDLRFFLGINPIGYVDSVQNVYSQWSIFDEGGNLIDQYQAGNKFGQLQFQAGQGIELDVTQPPAGGVAIRINNTGSGSPAQNAFSSINVKNNDNTIQEILTANTSSDTFSLKSGTFIKLSTDTNNDTITFDLDIEDDYVLLGNPGITDGMGLIDLSQENYCMVGRAGDVIKPLIKNDFAWGATTTNTPPFVLPYFGMIAVTEGGATKYLNANTGVVSGTYNTGVLRIVPGNNVTLLADDETNTLTINSTGGTGTGGAPTPSISQVQINSNEPFTVTLNTATPRFDKLQFINGAGINVFAGALTSDGRLPISFDLQGIAGQSIMGNVSSNIETPSAITFTNNNTILAKINNALDTWNIADSNSTSNTLKNVLDIRHYNSVVLVNDAGTTQSNGTFSALGTGARLGAALRFSQGNNITLSRVTNLSGDILKISVNSANLLLSDPNPTFNSQAFTSTIYGTRIRYNNLDTDTQTKNIVQQSLYGLVNSSGTGSDIKNGYFLGKEYLRTNSNITGITGTITSESGITGQYFETNSNVFEYIYANAYTLKISDSSNGSTWIRGDFTIQSDLFTVNADSDISFEGTGTGLRFNNRYISPGSSNILRLRSSSAGTPTVRVTGYNNTSTVCSAVLRLESKDTFILDLTNNVGLTISKNTLINSDIDLGMIGSGTINIPLSINFSGNLDFSSATITGLSFGNHASTHRYAQSLAANGSSPATDPIQAWHVGAVDRLAPVLNNTIYIGNGDGYFDFDTQINTLTDLYGQGAVVRTYSQFFDDTINNRSNADSGPLYVVLANGEEAALLAEPSASPKGPPGQIIMIRAE